MHKADTANVMTHLSSDKIVVIETMNPNKIILLAIHFYYEAKTSSMLEHIDVKALLPL